MKKPVLAPTDLTDVASKAIHQAAVIARKAGTSVTLLHVLNEKSPSKEDAERHLKADSLIVKEITGKKCTILLQEGSVFEAIPQLTCDQGFSLVVIGTHGVHGLKQHFMGPNILKLVRKVNIPVLVIQKDTPLYETFRTVIMPVSSHTDLSKQLDSILLFTSLFDTEVYLYSINKPGFPWPDQLLKNIEEAKAFFESKGVLIKRINESNGVYSQGYAKQTLMYAKSSEAEMISVITAPSEEYHYFADRDKEDLLLNELNLPVLCTG